MRAVPISYFAASTQTFSPVIRKTPLAIQTERRPRHRGAGFKFNRRPPAIKKPAPVSTGPALEFAMADMASAGETPKPTTTAKERRHALNASCDEMIATHKLH
jgi:hypothetical protein